MKLNILTNPCLRFFPKALKYLFVCGIIIYDRWKTYDGQHDTGRDTILILKIQTKKNNTEI